MCHKLRWYQEPLLKERGNHPDKTVWPLPAIPKVTPRQHKIHISHIGCADEDDSHQHDAAGNSIEAEHAQPVMNELVADFKQVVGDENHE